MANAEATPRDGTTVELTLTPEQASHVAQLVYGDIARLLETTASDLNELSVAEPPDHHRANARIAKLLADIEVQRKRLDEELGGGTAEGPVAVRLQRATAEDFARRLLHDGAGKIGDANIADDPFEYSTWIPYRDALRLAEAGAAIVDQLEATR